MADRPASRAGGLATELRHIALARALRDMDPAALAAEANRALAYDRAGHRAITANEDADALRREILRRTVFAPRRDVAA